MDHDKQFAEIFSDPRRAPSPAMTEEESYAAFVESMVPLCHCSERHRPCDGVLAGGLCDNLHDCRCEIDYCDFDDEDQEDSP